MTGDRATVTRICNSLPHPPHHGGRHAMNAGGNLAIQDEYA